MLQKREQELQQELAYIRSKLPQDEEPELPLKLQGDLLKQRLLAGEQAPYVERGFCWKQLAAMACCLILIMGIGWSSFAPQLMMDSAAPEAASMEAAQSMERSLPEETTFVEAISLEEETAALVEEELSQLKVLTYPAAAETTMEQLQQLYPELSDEDVTILAPEGSQYTVLRLEINGEFHSIAILSGAVEVDYDPSGCYILHDVDNDLYLKLHEETLDVLR